MIVVGAHMTHVPNMVVAAEWLHNGLIEHLQVPA